VGDSPRRAPITELLERARAGDTQAFDEVFSSVYEELRRLARARRRKQRGLAATMNTTAIVHEVYLRLCKDPHPAFTGRAHFMAVAAAAMRSILVDEARHRLRAKRGGGAIHEELDAAERAAVERDAETVLDVHEALERLRRSNPRLERVIEFRFFGGMTETEAAEALDCTDRTIRRDWVKAKAWLRHHLGEGPQPSL